MDQFIAEVISLKRHHAIELLHLARDNLELKATQHSQTARAELMTIETLYGDDKETWQKAKNLLSTLVGQDRARCIDALQKRSTYIRDHPINDELLTQHLFEGSRNNPRRATATGRNRSRSPRGNAPQGSNRGRSPTNANARRGNRPSTSTQNIENRPSTNTQGQSDRRPPSGQGRGSGRGGRRPRSNSRTRGALQFDRSNNMSRGRSPSNYNARSHNSLWNDNSNRGPSNKSRGKFTLSDDEASLITALRQSKYE